MSTNSSFINLPLKELIEIPLREMVVAQGSIANMTAEYIRHVGLNREPYYKSKSAPISEDFRDEGLNYGDNKLSSKGNLVLLFNKYRSKEGSPSIDLDTYIANNFDPATVEESPETYETRNITFSSSSGDKVSTVNAPLLSIVPIPSLLIDSATIKFDVKINSVVDEKENSNSIESSVLPPNIFDRGNKTVTGSIATNKIKSGSQQMDSNYIFEINLKQSDNEGLNKLLELLGESVNGKTQA
jgi:hypothetical protein